MTTTAIDSPADASRMLGLLADRIADAARRPLLICQEDAPGYLGISRRVFFLLKAEGAFRPVSIGSGNTVYRRTELEAWVRRLKHARG